MQTAVPVLSVNHPLEDDDVQPRTVASECFSFERLQLNTVSVGTLRFELRLQVN